MSKTYVTKPFLPPKEAYLSYINSIFDSGILTNHGPMVQQLEKTLSSFLGAEYFHYVTNGTIALQLALKALGIDGGEVITTPFSYVATTSSILWERCTPVFVDIEPEHFTIDPAQIEAAITPETKAIMAVHVFGYICDVTAIEAIAEKYQLKVIYDAAHAFGVQYQSKSVTAFGDISTLSFHATKLFHTIEGGACVTKDSQLADKISLLKCFGHDNDEHLMLGINAKQDEFNAAMGLAIFPFLPDIIAERKRLSACYDAHLKSTLYHPSIQQDTSYNYAYYPVVFDSEKSLLAAFASLHRMDVIPRRYFYPSLNKLPYLNKPGVCPVSEDISTRIACLPLFYGLNDALIEQIAAHL